MKLKYGCNPHQTEAQAEFIESDNPPFTLLNGQPGYINLLDALNAWQLVAEVRASLGIVAATSFKHVSPAGAAIGRPLSPILEKLYEFEDRELTPAARAYLRARGADPSSSFGDFVGLSDHVGLATAKILSKVVSDGIIAPSYDAEALELLKLKKQGAFIVLEANTHYRPRAMEHREVGGLRLSQSRNDLLIGRQHLAKRVGQKQEVSAEVEQDLVLGLITLKYTQSNSVGYVLDGQMIGIGAGQQSRVDCTKLAGRKADNWHLRQHAKVLGLQFKDEVKRQDRINWRLRFVEGDMTREESQQFQSVLAQAAPQFGDAEKRDWLARMSGVSFVSDAFIPFRDNIDHAAKHGVATVAHTGGSLRDDLVTAAADEYGMTMIHTGIRLFHH